MGGGGLGDQLLNPIKANHNPVKRTSQSDRHIDSIAINRNKAIATGNSA